MALRRIGVPYLANLLAPIGITPVGPLCLTCGRVLDYEALVEGYPGQTTFCRVLVRHHGAEELHEFAFDSVEWDHRDLKRAMQGARFFDPLKAGEQPMVAMRPANDNAVPMDPVNGLTMLVSNDNGSEGAA